MSEQVAELQSRLEELEVRYAFQENTIAELDGVVQRLNELCHALRDEVGELRAQVKEFGGEPNKLEDEKPPHY